MGYGHILALALMAALIAGCQTAQVENPDNPRGALTPASSGSVARAMNDPWAFGTGITTPGPFSPPI